MSDILDEWVRKLGDASSTVLRDTTRSLYKIGDARAVEPLCKALGNINECVRWLCVMDRRRLVVLTGLACSLCVLPRGIRPVAAQGSDRQQLSQDMQQLSQHIRDWVKQNKLAKAKQQDLIATCRVFLTKSKCDRVTRVLAAGTLGVIGSPASSATPDLITAYKNGDDKVRTAVVEALAYIGTSAIDPLIETLKKGNSEARVSAAFALGNLGAFASKAVPALTENLAYSDSVVHTQNRVRQAAEYGLMGIGPSAASAVPALTKALTDDDLNVRAGAAGALGTIGSSDVSAIPALTRNLKVRDDGHSSTNIRDYTAFALSKISESLPDQVPHMHFSRWRDILHQLETAQKTLQEAGDNRTIDAPYLQEAQTNVRRAIELMKVRPLYVVAERTMGWVSANGPIAFILGCVVVSWLTSLVMLLRWPLALLVFNDGLKRVFGVTLPAPYNLISSAPGIVLGAGFFHYHPRVLDAWVRKYADTTLQNMKERPTFSERSVYVDIKIGFPDGEYRPTPAAFHNYFARNRAVLVINGDGGSGKTALTCQLAQWALKPKADERLCKTHRMLPVFIEESLPGAKPGEPASLLESIRSELGGLTGEAEAPTDELVKNLLRCRRVLLIVDGLSELDAATQQVIRPNEAILPLNALIVTSRRDAELKNVRDLCLKTGLLKGQAIAAFIEEFLRKSGMGEPLKNNTLYTELNYFTVLVGDREISALLAGLYASNMLERMRNATVSRPKSVPDLMYDYVDTMCRRVDENAYPSHTYRPLARKVAWCYLKGTLHPIEIPATGLAEALSSAHDNIALPEGKKDWNAVLNTFVEPLRLMKRGKNDPEAIKFSLDPLAECLAAHYLLRHGGLRDDLTWSGYLDEVQVKHTPENSLKGYLLALYDTINTKPETDTPREFLLAELRNRFPDIWPFAEVKAMTG